MPPGNRVMREERRTNQRYKKVDMTSREQELLPQYAGDEKAE